MSQFKRDNELVFFDIEKMIKEMIDELQFDIDEQEKQGLYDGESQAQIDILSSLLEKTKELKK